MDKITVQKWQISSWFGLPPEACASPENSGRPSFHVLAARSNSVAREAAIGMLTSLLEQFRGAGFYVPRTREQLKLKFVGAPAMRDFILESLLARGVVEDEEGRGLQVVGKHTASVTALLDNGTLNGSVRLVAGDVVGRRH